jgi:hypothetical protein
MKALLRRWKALSIEERLTFLQALLLLPLAVLALRFGRYQSTIATLQKITPLKKRRSPADPLPEALRTAAIINAAAWRGLYDATCLRRSLVLWWLLRRRGIDSSVRIGVRTEEDEFFSHAWVEFEDTVINDAPDINKRFATIL